MNKLVQKHFDKQAKTYQHNWEKWPGSLLRRLEAKAINSLYSKEEIVNTDIIEFGSGSGYYTRILLTAAPKKIVAVDFSQVMLDNLPQDQRIKPMHGDAATIELQEKFHFILSTGMLEFVTDPSLVLTNIAKHALPGATLIILFPLNNWWGKLYRLFHRKHKIEIKLFSIRDFDNLSKPYWNIVKSRPCGLFSIAIKLTLN